jgi:glycosyltransferase involved in cell wall biosynthesis
VVRVAISVEQNWNAVPGGTARSTNRLIDALVHHTSVELVGFSGTHRADPALDLPTGLSVTEIPVPGRLLNQQWSWLKWPRIDRWVAADVLHAPAYSLPPTEGASVVTIHDLAFVDHPEWFTKHGARFFERFLAQVRSRRPLVIVPSISTAEACVGVGIDEDDVVVIPWGVASSTTTELQVVDVRRRFALPEHFVLFVGTREPRKNLTTLVAATNRLEVPLVVVGPDGWGEVDMGAAIVVGELGAVDLAGVMAAATLLAYPSHLEGFGLPVLEAMAQGTPVVVTKGTAPAEVAGKGGLAVRTDGPAPLADALQSVLASEALQQELGAAGSARAATFTWQRTAEQTADVYMRAAAR